MLLVSIVAIVLLAAVVSDPKSTETNGGSVILGILLFVGIVIVVWSTICVNAKRWHDNNKSGWWMLIGAIPLIGIWAFIENGFLRGTVGPNSFGGDPLA